MKNRTVLSSLACLSFFLIFAIFLKPVSAQEPPNATSSATLLATVGIYQAKIISNPGAPAFKISFVLGNGQGTQSGIKYAVQLFSRVSSTTRILIDEQVYDGSVDLNENETVTKQIEYTPPPFLKGVYQLWLLARNSAGLTLSVAKLSDVGLEGTGQYVEIDNRSCYLTVQNETPQKKYTRFQGVDISNEEKLIGTCEIINHFDKDIVVTPEFKTYYRTSFGNAVEDNKELQQEVSIKKGETKTISLILPKALAPQAYDARLSFVFQNRPVSNSIAFHYVLRGASATIQNLHLDKDYYLKGQNAQISFFWTPSADSFFGSRAGEGSDIGPVILDISIQNSSGEPCVEAAERQMTGQDSLTFTMPVIQNCKDPAVTVTLKQATSGNVLDKKTFTAKSQNVPGPEKTKFFLKEIYKYIIPGLAVLIGFIALMILRKKGKAASAPAAIILLFLLISGVVFLASVKTAQAFSQSAAFEIEEATFTIGLDNLSYCPSEAINMTASACGNYACENTVANAYLQVRAGTATQYQEILNGQDVSLDKCAYGNTSFTAESTPGTYNADFKGQVSLNNKTWSLLGSQYLRYTVLSPPTASITANGQAGSILVAAGTAATIAWNSTGATSCSVAPAGWTGTSGSQSTGALSSGTYTYTVTCNSRCGPASANINIYVESPIHSYYRCSNATCVQDDAKSVGGATYYTDDPTCANACVVVPKYKCSGSSCARDDVNGTFTDSNCNNTCVPLVSSWYRCNSSYTCEAVNCTGGDVACSFLGYKKTLVECQAACNAPPPPPEYFAQAYLRTKTRNQSWPCNYYGCYWGGWQDINSGTVPLQIDFMALGVSNLDWGSGWTYYFWCNRNISNPYQPSDWSASYAYDYETSFVRRAVALPIGVCDAKYSVPGNYLAQVRLVTAGYWGGYAEGVANFPVVVTPVGCTASCGSWGSCSAACGGGTQSRTCTRTDCSTYPETQVCNTQACTLSASLTANPASGLAPLSSNLTATVSGTAFGTTNYTFWKNCNSTCSTVQSCTTACGNYDAKYDGRPETSYSSTVSYASGGSYTPKVVVERGSAAPAQARTAVTVTNPVTYTLTVLKTGTGTGTVTSLDTKINCGGDCSEVYNSGNTTTLNAAAALGSTFVGWSGAGCSGTGSCIVTTDSSKTVTARFSAPVDWKEITP
ncbi:MAG: hypothetical protein V1845_00375 [bacterium]